MLPKLKLLLHLCLILFVGLIAYHNSFFGEFVFDDWLTIKNMRTLDKVASVWQLNPKRFLPNLTFYLNYQYSTDQVFYYHLINFFFHFLTAVIVYFFSSALTQHKKPSLALFISLLFISHPLNTQAVSYISQRYSIFAAFFYLLTTWLFFLSLKNKSFYLKLLSLITCICALVSKENTFSLPLVLLLTYFYRFPKPNLKQLFHYLWPYVFITLFLFLFVFNNPTAPSLTSATHGTSISPSQYFFTQINVVRTYLRLLILPLHQNLDYDYPIFSSPFNFSTIFSLILFIVLLLPTYLHRHRFPLIFYGLVFFFITLSVESSFLPIADVIFEHRLYLPSVGFFLALSVLLQNLSTKITRPHFVYLLAVLIISLLSLATVLRNRVWQTEVVLWQDVVSKSPHKARAHYNLGVSYGYISRYDLAQQEFITAISLNPYYTDAYHNLGAIYEQQNNYSQAAANYLKAYQLNPSDPKIQARLNRLLGQP